MKTTVFQAPASSQRRPEDPRRALTRHGRARRRRRRESSMSSSRGWSGTPPTASSNVRDTKMP